MSATRRLERPRGVRLVRGEGRDVSGWYEERDETCPVGTGGAGGRGVRRLRSSVGREVGRGAASRLPLEPFRAARSGLKWLK